MKGTLDYLGHHLPSQMHNVGENSFSHNKTGPQVDEIIYRHFHSQFVKLLTEKCKNYGFSSEAIQCELIHHLTAWTAFMWHSLSSSASLLERNHTLVAATAL